MSSSLNYQPWLKAVLRIAKHYRIETSEEQLRLQLNWNQSDSIAETLTLITRQLGMSLRQVPFSQDLLNPWLLPVVVELSADKSISAPLTKPDVAHLKTQYHLLKFENQALPF